MRNDNELLAFVQAHQEACEVEFTLMRCMSWIIAAGLAVVGAILVLSFN